MNRKVLVLGDEIQYTIPLRGHKMEAHRRWSSIFNWYL